MTRYKQGKKIKTLNALTKSKAFWFMVRGRVRHRNSLEALNYGVLKRVVESGNLHEAIRPNDNPWVFHVTTHHPGVLENMRLICRECGVEIDVSDERELQQLVNICRNAIKQRGLSLNPQIQLHFDNIDMEYWTGAPF